MTLGELQAAQANRMVVVLYNPDSPRHIHYRELGIIWERTDLEPDGTPDWFPIVWVQWRDGSLSALRAHEIRPARLRPGFVFEIKSTFRHTHNTKQYCGNDQDAARKRHKYTRKVYEYQQPELFDGVNDDD